MKPYRTSTPQRGFGKDKTGQLSPIKIGIVAGIVIIVLAAVTFFLSRPEAPESPPGPVTEAGMKAADCGIDQGCFLRNADGCTPATGTATIAGVTVRNEILEDCVFQKTVTSVPSSEPEEFKTLFEGKSMTCPYDKDGFDPRLAYNLTLGIELCDGSLKDAIDAFIEAYEERAAP